VRAAAAISSTRAAFCWVAWSSCCTAEPICDTPSLCSRLAAVMLATSWVTR
jgi:hypothetical protein